MSKQRLKQNSNLQATYTGMGLTLVMLNKLAVTPISVFSQSDYLIQIVDKIHKQCRSREVKKPTDLYLHCLQKQVSRTRVNKTKENENKKNAL